MKKNRLVRVGFAILWIAYFASLALIAKKHAVGSHRAFDFVTIYASGFLMPLSLHTAHEGLHAIAARLGGFRVFEIKIGGGLARWSRVVRGIRWTLGLNVLGGGMCSAAHHDLRSKAPMVAYMGTPLGFHAVLAAGLAPYTSLATDSYGLPVGLIDITFMVNLLIVVTNLWPIDHAHGGAMIPSDGKLLLALAKEPNFVEEYRRAAATNLCVLSSLNGDTESASRFAQEAKLNPPTDWESTARLFAAHFFSEQFEQIVSTWEESRPSIAKDDYTNLEREVLLLGIPPTCELPELLYLRALCRVGRAVDAVKALRERATELDDGALRAIYLNNEAYDSIRYTLESTNLDHCLSISNEAMDLLPWSTFIRGTLGITMIENGLSAEGLAHLDGADKLGTNVVSAPIRHAYRALAHAQLGDQATVDFNLAKARMYALEQDTVDEISSRVADLAALPKPV